MISPGGWFNIKMLTYQYRDSHCKNKTVSCIFVMEISIPGKTVFILKWDQGYNGLTKPWSHMYNLFHNVLHNGDQCRMLNIWSLGEMFAIIKVLKKFWQIAAKPETRWTYRLRIWWTPYILNSLSAESYEKKKKWMNMPNCTLKIMAIGP